MTPEQELLSYRMAPPPAVHPEGFFDIVDWIASHASGPGSVPGGEHGAGFGGFGPMPGLNPPVNPPGAGYGAPEAFANNPWLHQLSSVVGVDAARHVAQLARRGRLQFGQSESQPWQSPTMPGDYSSATVTFDKAGRLARGKDPRFHSDVNTANPDASNVQVLQRLFAMNQRGQARKKKKKKGATA